MDCPDPMIYDPRGPWMFLKPDGRMPRGNPANGRSKLFGGLPFLGQCSSYTNEDLSSLSGGIFFTPREHVANSLNITRDHCHGCVCVCVCMYASFFPRPPTPGAKLWFSSWFPLEPPNKGGSLQQKKVRVMTPGLQDAQREDILHAASFQPFINQPNSDIVWHM